jgi:hypothetical protein
MIDRAMELFDSLATFTIPARPASAVCPAFGGALGEHDSISSPVQQIEHQSHDDRLLSLWNPCEWKNRGWES